MNSIMATAGITKTKGFQNNIVVNLVWYLV